MTIWEIFPDHPISYELKVISGLLDQHPRVLQLASADLVRPGTQDTGRSGFTVDSIIRAAILKQMMGFSYEQLAFMVSDSRTFQAFTRITQGTPSASALQGCISGITDTTWERINHIVLEAAHRFGVERGRVTRTDATVMETNIHKPSDSSLLEDAVKLMFAKLRGLSSVGYPIAFCDHRRGSKKHARQIQHMRKSAKQVATYRKLLKLVHKTREYLRIAIELHGGAEPEWAADASTLVSRVDQVINQTERRVLRDESVPAEEKLFSLHEPHTDIIKKGRRDVQFGHKLNLTSGVSGMIIDMVVEEGNPADSTRAVRMVERQIDIYGKPPRQTCFDGGYACKANVTDIKALGVKDVAFHKKRGIEVKEMTKSAWLFKKLVKFRAGIEGNISTLKRRYSWYRCNWKGLARYKAFAWLSVVAYNLVTLGRELTL